MTRLFTFDFRKKFFENWANQPQVQRFAVDAVGDGIFVIVGGTVGRFSISRFPTYQHEPVSSVYVRSMAVDDDSRLLVLGGFNQSGVPPITVFDTRLIEFREFDPRRPWFTGLPRIAAEWFVTNLSNDFMVRTPQMAARLDAEYGPHRLSAPLYAVYAVAMSSVGRFIITSGSKNAPWMKVDETSGHVLMKWTLRGELVGEAAGLDSERVVLSSDGGSVALAVDNEVVMLNAGDLSLLRRREVAGSRVADLSFLDDPRGLIVVSEEGEISILDHNLNRQLGLTVNAIPRCLRFEPTSRTAFVGTSFGDVLALDRAGTIVDHVRVTESVRDIAFVHDGRHAIVGCKNGDLHVFRTHFGASQPEEWAAWENRLSERSGPLRTSTCSFTDARVFISYASADSNFAERLERRLLVDGIKCWRDAHHLTAGRLTTQIQRAIEHHDVLILVLSEASLASDWVRWEVERARAIEKSTRRDVICPLALDASWEGWSDDPILKREIVKYHIVSFADCVDNTEFEAAYQRLITGLRVNYLPKDESE